ncbi:MAG: thiamine diphosphokinase [Verrucomicrobiota bacterium]
MRKAVIVLGGETPNPELLKEHLDGAQFSIAADSGLESFKQAGLKADLAVGDFDSFIGDPGNYADTCMRAPEQDATDFQKALRKIENPAPDLRIVILGGTGKRADHFLTNLLIVAEKWPEVSFEFHDAEQSIYRVSPQCPFKSDQFRPGLTISLIPMSKAEGVTTQGLYWELENVCMNPEGQLGQSNVLQHTPLHVSISAGSLFVIVNYFEQS